MLNLRKVWHSEIVRVLIALVSYAAAENTSGGKGVGLPELEFIVGQLSYAECQQLADTLRTDFGSKNPIEGVTCLDDLIRQQSELENEGSNIARGIFRHKLNQIGRQDLSEWLSIVREPMAKTRTRNAAALQSEGGSSGNPGGNNLDIFGKSTPKSWCEIIVTVALIYTAALLIWLTVRILLCRMKRELRTRGLANNGLQGYSYYPTKMNDYPVHPFPAPPYQPPPQHLQAVPSQHGAYYFPQPTPSTKSMHK
ncbi:hypothetical protein GE061_005684 [Apolygus lucorum]|uniref:Uncharacterized protein n=1 Tax=Apolygus lucorum TaxID=248454 RepID=A0A8S9WWY6_APOLU|nr:hypothetical protein GE061_005684 [Apolygus lucorum]